MSPWWRVVFFVGLVAVPARAAAPVTVRPPADPMFGLTVVHHMHLTISEKDWATMQPRRGGLGPAAKPGEVLPDGRVVRSQFGFDFEYVPAALTIDGVTFDKVGVRFKGNSSYAVTSRVLKRPFKIDLDRYVEGQEFKGQRKLALNNGVMDGSLTREALAYVIYREAGVPASRTAFALLTLTVPGKYDKEVVGVYNLIEVVDKEFMEDRFGSRKGMLLKPERVGPLDHLGTDWARYEERYRPKVTPSKKVQQRFMAFTKLVQEADSRRFKAEIGDYLDVDCFLRYLAASALMSSMDSFMALPHNYYIHHDPLTNRFRILPWDVDHAFGGLTMFGSSRELIDLSIRQPWLGRNPLIEKLMRDPATADRYRAIVESLLKTTFTAERVRADAQTIQRVTADGRAKERLAVQKRGDSWSIAMLLSSGAGTPEAFTPKRVAAVRAQLDGTAKGVVMTSRFGRPPLPAAALMAALDRDGDGWASVDEARAGAKALFAACAADGKGEVDVRALTVALEKVWPGARPGGFFGPPSQAALMARAIFRDVRGGKMKESDLVARAEKAFGTAAKLDEFGLEAAMRKIMGR